MNENKISISNGNIKMGAIKSFSLPPIVTCPSGCPCAAKCYALRMVKRFPNVRKAYQKNLALYEASKDGGSDFWRQIIEASRTERFFRFHVSGDIPDREYFIGVIGVAYINSETHFLMFTKRYDIVNSVLAQIDKPDNLQIIFSEWGEGWRVDNPHNLPTAKVRFRGSDKPLEGFECPGNCSACAANGSGCWSLKKGESVVFNEH